jgi:HK97 family phage major capsid protein
MSGVELRVPTPDWTTTTAIAGGVYAVGGVNARWGFGQAPAEVGEAGFRSISLYAWDLLSYANISNGMLNDLAEAENKLLTLFSDALSWHSEYAFLQGTGVDAFMPQGVLNSPGTIKITRGVPATIQDTDITRCAAQLLPGSWPTALWLTSPSCLLQIFKVPHVILNEEGEYNSGYVGNLVGRPLFVTDKLPDVTQAGCLVLMDPKLYLIGLRRDSTVELSRSDPSVWANNRSIFRLHMRVDGKLALNAPVTLPNGSLCSAAVVLV